MLCGLWTWTRRTVLATLTRVAGYIMGLDVPSIPLMCYAYTYALCFYLCTVTRCCCGSKRDVIQNLITVQHLLTLIYSILTTTFFCNIDVITNGFIFDRSGWQNIILCIYQRFISRSNVYKIYILMYGFTAVGWTLYVYTCTLLDKRFSVIVRRTVPFIKPTNSPT